MRRLFSLPRAYVLLFLVVLAFRVATALPLQQTGYMDAAYAVHVAENLAHGRGFVEDILWNYLDNPAGLPHPSNLYWMPLPSLLIAPLFALFGVSYHVAQIPFILLSSLLPLVAFHISRRVFARDDYAWAAAILTACSGFYTVYWVSPDNFSPFALSASLSLYAIACGMEMKSKSHFVVAGFLVALSHLSRADGALLLAVAPIALLLRKSTRAPRDLALFTSCFLLGYLILMSPWFIRNYVAVGTPYPSAGAKTIWMIHYDEIFRYAAEDLTPARYLEWGMGNIIASKARAAGLNLLVVVFGALQVFLAPFAIVGLWRLRQRIEMLPFFIYAVLLYLVMSLVFTEPSWRGSMLHSSAVLLPFLAVAAPLGTDLFVRWIARYRRTWNAEQASHFFRAGFVALAVFFSLFLYVQGIFGAVIGGSGDIPLWNQRDIEYSEIARWLDRNARPDDVVMEVDPPAFYNSSHRQTIVTPTDSVDAIFDAARRYGARYLILRFDHPKPLADLYAGRVPVPGLARVAEFQDALGRPVMLFQLTR